MSHWFNFAERIVVKPCIRNTQAAEQFGSLCSKFTACLPLLMLCC
ncbi:hypothetical protein M513_05245 [Trichuris suis]|uniref:Uncharacterized protein n=1 Tax=Trichuris suis TaxID=68888 RepID=A0A085M9T2_9BILA|nr:hypothetical protein M513_05245 [Trichuris suis]